MGPPRRNFQFHSTIVNQNVEDGRFDCSYSYRPWQHTDFTADSFEQGTLFESRRGFNRGRGLLGRPPSLRGGRGNWHRNLPSYVSSLNKQGAGAWCNEANSSIKESDQDSSEVDIEDFRSSIAKKADLASPSSTDNVDAKTKSTLNFSAKASQIIDDVLMGRPPKPKIVSKRDLELSKVLPVEVSTEEKKLKSNKRTQLLEKAKQICEHSRIKRQLTKKERMLKDSQKREQDMEQLNREIDGLTTRAMGNITNSSKGSTDTNDIPGVFEKRAGLSLQIPETFARNDTSGTTTRRSNSPLLSSPGSQNKTKIGKDNLKKLVTAPRSRKEQMMVAKMMQNYTRTKTSLRSRLATTADPQSDLESPIHIEDLPDEVQMQIAQLLEEEADGDAGNTDPGIMDITELEANKVCNVIDDSEDDLEMVMISEGESLRRVRNKPSQDDESDVEVIEHNEQTNRSTSKTEASGRSETDDTASNGTVTDPNQSKRRRRHPDAAAKVFPPVSFIM